MQYDVIIIGAGASGLICASEAARRKRSVLVVDHMKSIGSKIRVSGGGRCNFTNLIISPENYISGNVDFCRSALSRFGPSDFTGLLDRHGIQYREKSAGQLFLTKGSEEIINMLHKECSTSGVELLLQTGIRNVIKDGLFELSTDKGRFTSSSLVVATGGLSYPALGATGIGYRIAKSFGMEVTELQPGLVPFEFQERDLKTFSTLSGISVRAGISCNKARFTENILFTHRGLSGPGILQISLYWSKGGRISIDLLPDLDASNYLTSKSGSNMILGNAISSFFPRRLVRSLFDETLTSKPLKELSSSDIQGISARLHKWVVTPRGPEGYNKAEVTRGGVDTRELSSKTMESKKVPGLFFAGEVIDITGQLGGYNLQWAWSSGHAAGQYV
ncbi:MAG: NAD(P)/FAD-dependent oxidoreductase [Nitrospirae bacterium]|nr:NAD(P)/FAD-dependent oxidoreductase [Nitrospirota bacterium]